MFWGKLHADFDSSLFVQDKNMLLQPTESVRLHSPPLVAEPLAHHPAMPELLSVSKRPTSTEEHCNGA